MKKIIIIILLFLPLLTERPAYGRDGSGLVQTWQDLPPSGAPETAEPTPQPAAPWYWAVGNPWADTSDDGHCLGFAPFETAAAPPALSWPTDSRVVHESRGFRAGHPAIDILAPYGANVYAAAAGTVVWAGESDYFGNDALVVAVHHGAGWVTIYAHLSAVLAACGEWVSGGELIGRVGMTGASTFEHLHFALYNGLRAYRPNLAGG